MEARKLIMVLRCTWLNIYLIKLKLENKVKHLKIKILRRNKLKCKLLQLAAKLQVTAISCKTKYPFISSLQSEVCSCPGVSERAIGRCNSLARKDQGRLIEPGWREGQKDRYEVAASGGGVWAFRRFPTGRRALLPSFPWVTPPTVYLFLLKCP